MVARGRKAVTIDGVTYRYDPFNYLVLSRGMRFDVEILEASIEKPFLSFVLQIDHAIVRRITAKLREHTKDPHSFVLYEQYESGEAFDAHVASPRYQGIARDQIRPLLRDRTVEFCRVITPAPDEAM